MKTTIRSCSVIIGCALGLLALPQTGNSQGFYLDVHAGGAIAQDVDLKKMLVNTPGAELDLKPGMHLNVGGGYNINQYFAVQLDTGFIYNRIDNLKQSDGDDGYGALRHIPMVAELVFRYDKPDSKWVPFAGLGAGADWSILALDDIQAPNGAVVDGLAGDVVFAWQAFAGVRYKFTQNMTLGGGYKFYWADGAEWDVDGPGSIETGHAIIHTLGVDFTMTF